MTRSIGNPYYDEKLLAGSDGRFLGFWAPGEQRFAPFWAIVSTWLGMSSISQAGSKKWHPNKAGADPGKQSPVGLDWLAPIRWPPAFTSHPSLFVLRDMSRADRGQMRGKAGAEESGRHMAQACMPGHPRARSRQPATVRGNSSVREFARLSISSRASVLLLASSLGRPGDAGDRLDTCRIEGERLCCGQGTGPWVRRSIVR